MKPNLLHIWFHTKNKPEQSKRLDIGLHCNEIRFFLRNRGIQIQEHKHFETLKPLSKRSASSF